MGRRREEDDGADLLYTQEDSTRDQYIGNEQEVLQHVRQLVITKCDSYFITRCDKYCYKVRQVLQSVTVLLQSTTGLSKCDDYRKVRQNKVFSQNLLIEVLSFFHHFYNNLNIVILAKLNRKS